MRLPTPLLAVAPLLLCATLSAQLRPVQVGARARVAYNCLERTLYGGITSYECNSAIGRVSDLTTDSIVLRADYGDTQLTVPFGTMQRFELGRGERHRQLKGMGIGFAAGTVMGLAWAGMKRSNPASPNSDPNWWFRPAILAVPLAIVGAYVSNVWSEEWEEMPLSWVRASAIRQPGGMSFGVSVAF